MDVIKILFDPKSKIVISIILGLGLAAAFKKSCGNGKNCIVVKGPKTAEIEGKQFRIRDQCYQYMPRVVECDDDRKVIKT